VPRLATLVEHGLLERRRYSEHPEAFEYLPTDKGRDVSPVLVTLMQWGDRHATPSGGPPRVHVHTACGHDAHPQLTCAHCHERIRAGELKVRPGPGADARQRAAGVRP
jgi:HxlR-like helix-turn-helix